MRLPKEQGPISKQTVRDAVSRFLSDSSATTGRYVDREIKRSVQEVIGIVTAAGWDAYIVGGTIRDLVLGPRIVGSAAHGARDIDIVLVGVEFVEMKKEFDHLYVRDTRFGGLHLIDRKPEGWGVQFDIWALEQTWAFNIKPVPVNISSFPQTPFLNLDSIAVEVSGRRGMPRQIFEDGFIDGINTRTIEINFEPNPYPDICLVRALIMAAKLQYAIGPKLLDFVLRRARATSINQLMAAQRSHYGTDRCSAEELSRWIQTLKTFEKAGLRESRIEILFERQLELWNNYPDSATPEKEVEHSRHEFIHV